MVGWPWSVVMYGETMTSVSLPARNCLRARRSAPMAVTRPRGVAARTCSGSSGGAGSSSRTGNAGGLGGEACQVGPGEDGPSGSPHLFQYGGGSECRGCQYAGQEHQIDPSDTPGNAVICHLYLDEHAEGQARQKGSSRPGKQHTNKTAVKPRTEQNVRVEGPQRADVAAGHNVPVA
uniref:Uncharacterized protein n=1 Tax=Chlamydomonas euryale TaxID=1486919 RepID=A0A7R9Z7F9_9CHLO|mmetsp:Transcript_8510/g.25791  ORF Transcript_8510/g.25791 Transcript_8510/m.25791 type:complete len:177 (+) Transcript_8510:1159-1689(+)|eukprot:365168-Chlamydomonas_euryale.AAC.7